jgi:predicted ribosomally synthesized peptide with SipW-like signal peptide
MTKSEKFMEKLRKRKKTNRNKTVIQSEMVIKKSIFKIVSFLVIASLNWTGLSAVGYTVSYFNDTENSTTNTYTAGTLNAELSVADDFSPAVVPTQTSACDIAINSTGSLEFQYDLVAENFSGDTLLCDNLNLVAKLGAAQIYSGKLNSFNVPATILASLASANLNLEVSLPDSADSELGNKTCTFDLKLDAWQTNSVDNLQGFSDTKTISNTVNSGTWTIAPPSAPDIVINEFLPNPSGSGTDGDSMPGGEWVELYNRGTATGDVNNWVLYDSDDSHELDVTSANTDTGGTTIAPGGFLVVYRNGDSDFALNNSGGDSVRLYNASISSGGTLIDSYIYTTNASDGKSFARIPDGSNNWVDPIPTPGSPNKMEEAAGTGTAQVQDAVEVPVELEAVDNSADAGSAEPTVETPVILENTGGTISEPDNSVVTLDASAGNDENTVQDAVESNIEDPIIVTEELVVVPEDSIIAPSVENNSNDSSQPEDSDSGSAETAVQADNTTPE